MAIFKGSTSPYSCLCADKSLDTHKVSQGSTLGTTHAELHSNDLIADFLMVHRLSSGSTLKTTKADRYSFSPLLSTYSMSSKFAVTSGELWLNPGPMGGAQGQAWTTTTILHSEMQAKMDWLKPGPVGGAQEQARTTTTVFFRERK